MDLITGLSQALGIDDSEAKAVAGAVLGTVQAQVAEEDAEAAAKVDEAVPELGGWLEQATSFATDQAAPAAGGGMLGGLMGMASSGGGNALLGAVAGEQARHAAILAGVLSKVGLDSSKAAMAAPFVLSFLQERMDPAWMSRIIAVAPMLSGGSPSGTNPGLMGTLGGLLS